MNSLLKATQPLCQEARLEVRKKEKEEEEVEDEEEEGKDKEGEVEGVDEEDEEECSFLESTSFSTKALHSP